MNREIRFRAWDGARMIYNGDLVKPSHLTNYPNKCFTAAKVYHNTIEVWFLETQLPNSTNEHFDHPTTYKCTSFMQYTGLKDKNGKNIYEGDRFDKVDSGLTGEVYFDDGAFRIKYGYKTPTATQRTDYFFSCVLDSSVCQHIEIIGSIFTHPHLIQ